jgi:protein phosphatase
VRSLNEDLALETNTLFAVADGMGGHAGGEVAARIAIDALEEHFSHDPSVDGLVEAVHEANQAVWDRGHEDAALRGMGTTLVAAALVNTDGGDRLVLANVGDSRAYRFHRDELGQMTVDHSVAEELVARGELSQAEALVHPHRHILTRALGVDPDVEVDIWELVPEEGDRFLLCSDGLSNEVMPEEMSRVLAGSRDPREAAESLVRMANESGGNDNITAVVLDVLVADATAGSSEDGAGSSASVAGRTVSAPPGRETIPPRAAGATTVPPQDLAAEAARGTPTTLKAPPPRRPTPRRVTLRVVLFAIVLGAIGYGAWSVIRWYVDNSYFVSFRNGHVAIFEGRKGGFLGMDPKVVNTSDITQSQVPSYITPNLRAGVEEPSRSAARAYVRKLNQQLCAEQTPPAGLQCLTPPTPSPTTTVLSPTTTRAADRAPENASPGGSHLRASAGQWLAVPVARAAKVAA